MNINTSALRKIHQSYNPEHDLGPDAPIHWSVEQLTDLVGRLVEAIEAQDERIEGLESTIREHLAFHLN